MPATDFPALDDTLRRAGAACDAAETHGTVCGALCAGVDEDDAWMDHLMDEASGPEEAQAACRRTLRDLCDETRGLLRAGALEFAPLLPDDETGLADRTDALGEWCQGFLFGLGLAGAKLKPDELSDETGEVLKDLGQIANAGFEGEDSEEDETAYAEVVEYVRVGVQLLYEELQAPGPPMPPSEMVH
jgi:yecA family protein